MGRKRRRLGVIESIEMETAGAEGKAIGHTEGKVVFVTGAVPGDVVDVQLTRKKSSFLEGRAVKFHTLSDLRTEPFCEHFGICGGCKWQMLQYEQQLHYKQDEVTQNLKRIGHLELPDVTPILPSPKTREYRNKLEYTFSAARYLLQAEIDGGEQLEKRGLGFHIPGRFDKVVDVTQCHLQGAVPDQIRNEVRTFALEHDYAFFNLQSQEGLLRNLIIRTTTTSELMVIICFYHDDKGPIEALLDHLSQKFAQITSLMYIINPKGNDSYYDLNVHSFKGKDWIEEEMKSPALDEKLKFKIGPKSFFQVNAEQAQNLYTLAYDLASLTGKEIVYDLYTGTGTIACFVAPKAQKVVGIEYVAEAIEDAKQNAASNGIDNCSFFAGDIKDVLSKELIEAEGAPDVIITDPPRAGMHEDVVMQILKSNPQKIVYISCNSATQARDIALMSDKYDVKHVQAVDMFPHTHHVESIVLLERKQST